VKNIYSQFILNLIPARQKGGRIERVYCFGDMGGRSLKGALNKGNTYFAPFCK